MVRKRRSVWAVFDRDTHTHFDVPVQKCRDLGIGVARSNPCFEVWLILHYEDFHRSDDHHQVQKWLTKLSPKYDRKGSKIADFEKMLEKLLIAEARAEKQLERRKKEGSPFGRPSTTVFELTRAICGRSEKKRGKGE